MLVPLILWLALIQNDRPPVPLPIAGCGWVRAENDGAGAGFIIDVDRKLFITCRHLVADRAKVDVFLPWVRDGVLVTDRAEYLQNRLLLRKLGLLVTGSVLSTSDERDLALLELESLPHGAKSLTLAANPPKVGESLRVVGNRLDLDTLWNLSLGPLRATGRLTEGYFWRGNKLAVNAHVFLGQLPTEEGDSGGPVFDSAGEVVGMASALRRQCPLAAVIISADEIRKFANQSQAPVKGVQVRDVPEALIRSTVWIRPTRTDTHLAGVLIEDDLVLTIGKGLISGDRCGIAFPIRDADKWIAERAAYRDPLALHLQNRWRGGTILAHDVNRDLALIRLDSPVEFMRPVRFAARKPAAGDTIHTMNHPAGIEFAWVYASGAIRQIGRSALVAGDTAPPISVLVCQIPAQAGSPGGAALNDRGELIGIFSAKEAAQMVGFAVSSSELSSFVESALAGRPLTERLTKASALALARQANLQRRAGQLDEARRDSDRALAIDPTCVPARVCRARLLPSDAALIELDAAVEKGEFNRAVLLFRAELATVAKDFRKARGDLERLLDVDPADAEARQRLVGIYLELGDESKAASAVADTLRADPDRLKAVAGDLLVQADSLSKKYPDVPSIPAGWLLKSLAAGKQDGFASVLKQAAGAKDDKERLAILRAQLSEIAKQ